MILESQGEQDRIRIEATYSNGKRVDVTESSKLVYRSSNRNIVTVDAYGMVKAVVPRKGSITATYLEGGRSFRTSVPITVEGGVVTAEPSSLNFGGNGGIPVGTSASQQVTFTYETTNETIRIKKVEIVSEFSQTNDCLSPSTVRTERQCTVTVTFNPKAAGERGGEPTVFDTFRVAPITIPLIGRATDRE